MESNGSLHSGSFEPNIDVILDKYKPGLGGIISASKSNPQFIKNEDGIFDKNPGWVEIDPETQYDYVEYDPNLIGNEHSYEMHLKKCFIEDFQAKYEKNRENYKTAFSEFIQKIPDLGLRSEVLKSMFGTEDNEQLKITLDFESYMDLMAERVIEWYVNHSSKRKLKAEINELKWKLSQIKQIPLLPI